MRPTITRNGKDPDEENTTVSFFLKKNTKTRKRETQKGTRETQKIKRKKPLRCSEKERTLPIQQVKEIK